MMGRFDLTPGGYTMIGATDLQDAGKQGAFVALYNNQGGLMVQTSFTSTNCCFKSDATTGADLFLKGADVYPSDAGMRACNATGGYLVGTIYQLELLPDDSANQFFAAPPLDPTFFTTNPATAGTGCAFGGNPALFWKVTQ